MAHIFRVQRERKTHEEPITDLYWMNNGKPSFIRGYHPPNDVYGKRDLTNVLLILRASKYKYTILTDYKRKITCKPIELHKQKLSDGFILSEITYNTEAKKEFEDDNMVDINICFEKDFRTESYIYRYYDFAAYQKTEKHFLKYLAPFVEDIRYKGKFPNSTLKIYRLPSYFTNGLVNK